MTSPVHISPTHIWSRLFYIKCDIIHQAILQIKLSHIIQHASHLHFLSALPARTPFHSHSTYSLSLLNRLLTIPALWRARGVVQLKTYRAQDKTYKSKKSDSRIYHRLAWSSQEVWRRATVYYLWSSSVVLAGGYRMCSWIFGTFSVHADIKLLLPRVFPYACFSNVPPFFFLLLGASLSLFFYLVWPEPPSLRLIHSSPYSPLSSLLASACSVSI